MQEHAGRYGVAALVAYAVRPHASPAQREWCDRVLVDSWSRYARMLGYLEYIIGLFADAGIPVISLKGPLLGQRYYTPPFLRKPSMDLDLAVTQQHLQAACKSLIAAGYRQSIPIEEAVARSHHVELTHPSRPKVELHFRLSHMDLGIPVDEFFERAISRSLPNGQEVLVLGAADQLLHLVLHLAHSRFGSLFHLYEVRKVLRAEPPDVSAETFRRAIDRHFCGAMRMTDIAFRELWGDPFLFFAIGNTATWFDWRLKRNLYRSFERWSVPGRQLNFATRLWGRWLDFQITDTPSDACRLVRHLTRSACFQNARRVWNEPKSLVYAPCNVQVQKANDQ